MLKGVEALKALKTNPSQAFRNRRFSEAKSAPSSVIGLQSNIPTIGYGFQLVRKLDLFRNYKNQLI